MQLLICNNPSVSAAGPGCKIIGDLISNKKFVLIIIAIVAIELSGHGIFASLFRLISSMN